MLDALGFDVYGTLVDPLAMREHLRRLAGERADALAGDWRTRQVEYAFRRALMGRWVTFEVCTAQALRHAAATAGIALSPDEEEGLLEHYRRLPAFPDVRQGLQALRAAGHHLVAFSNGSGEVVRQVLGHAGLLDLLDDVVSVEEVATFKPHPSVYALLTRRLGRAPDETWLVSGNAWDALGAKGAGLRAAWLRRSPRSVLDPWGIDPDLIVADVPELATALAQRAGGAAGATR